MSVKFLAFVSKSTHISLYKSILYLSGLVILFILALQWRLTNIDAFGLNNDEGAYLMWAKLVAQGHPLYQDTQSVSMPLFIEILALNIKFFGFSIVKGRLLILAFSVVLAGVLALYGYQLAGWLGAYFAGGLSLIIPAFFALSRQVMGEIPATLFAIVSIFLIYHFTTRQQRLLYLILGGVCLALSLLIKSLYPAALIPIAYLLLRMDAPWTLKLRYSLIFGLSLGVTGLLFILPYNFADFYDQAIRFRSEVRAVVPWDWRNNWRELTLHLNQYWGLWLVALTGLLMSIKQIRTQAWGLFLLANLGLIMWHSPLFPHHLIILIPGLFLLALDLVAYLRKTPSTWWVWGIMLIASLNIYAFMRIDTGWLTITMGGREIDAARVLDDITRVDDYVISDSQLLALLAGRNTPPPLGDVALVAIKAGRQTSSGLITISQAYRVEAVALWALRLPWLPDYLDWVKQNYLAYRIWDPDHQLFFVRKHPPDQPVPNFTLHHFEKSITLMGHQIEADIAKGQALPLTLYWSIDQALTQDYTVFVQLLDGQGQVAAQYDSQPYAGHFPTTAWPVQEIIPDRRYLPIPEDLPSGDYRLIAGLYNWQTGERISRKDTADDYVLLETVRVQ